MRKEKNGFTLIELLVVVSIIGLIASIILASLRNARYKANDAKIKNQLSEIRNATSLYLSSNNDYGIGIDGTNSGNNGQTIGGGCNLGMFGDPKIKPLLLANNYPETDARCTVGGSGYAVSARLSDNTYWCVDSQGSAIIMSSVQLMSQGTCTNTSIYVC